MFPDKRILSFLGLAFGISWTIAGIGLAFGVRATSGIPYTVMAALVMLGPALAAIIQQRLLDKAPWSGLGLQLRGTRWSVVAWTACAAICIVPLTLAVVHVLGDLMGMSAFGMVEVSHERIAIAVRELASGKIAEASIQRQVERLSTVPAMFILVFALGAALIAAMTFNLPFMLGEELGWRGYLWQRTAAWNGARRVGSTGLVWGLWHAPLIAAGHNYPGEPLLGIVMMVLFCLTMALLFDWTRTRSMSIWSSCLLHGTINGSAGVTALFMWQGHPLVGSIAGLAGVIAVLVLAAAVLLLDGSYRRSFLGSTTNDAVH
ncbi:MAG: CPBP family intramembrane metalloprotease [Flavobacteriales bacterium]|nr:CPBP family intramembrane metalloprotease [Flavobacteriales bacterium]